jgi:hypothetical protein
MYTRPTTPLPIGGVIDDAIKLYRGSFRACAVISLVGSLVLAAAGFYVALKFRGVTANPAGSQAVASEMLRLMGEMGSGFLGWYLVILLVTLWVYCALFAQVNSVAEGREQTAVDAMVQGLRRVPGAILASLVFMIAITIGLILLLIPGIWLWGKLQFWLASVFADEVGAIEGLGRSWTATTGNWWRSSVILTVALIIIIVLETLVSFASAIMIGVMTAIYHADFATMLIAQEILRAIVSIFVLPMFPVAMLAIYYDLKLRREGGDLAARAKSLQPA